MAFIEFTDNVIDKLGDALSSGTNFDDVIAGTTIGLAIDGSFGISFSDLTWDLIEDMTLPLAGANAMLTLDDGTGESLEAGFYIMLSSDIGETVIEGLYNNLCSYVAGALDFVGSISCPTLDTSGLLDLSIGLFVSKNRAGFLLELSDFTIECKVTHLNTNHHRNLNCNVYSNLLDDVLDAAFQVAEDVAGAVLSVWDDSTGAMEEGYRMAADLIDSHGLTCGYAGVVSMFTNPNNNNQKRKRQRERRRAKRRRAALLQAKLDALDEHQYVDDAGMTSHTFCEGFQVLRTVLFDPSTELDEDYYERDSSTCVALCYQNVVNTYPDTYESLDLDIGFCCMYRADEGECSIIHGSEKTLETIDLKSDDPSETNWFASTEFVSEWERMCKSQICAGAYGLPSYHNTYFP